MDTSASFGECASHSHCHMLEPYFSDNYMLMEKWAEGGYTQLVKELKAEIQNNPDLDDGIFASQGAVDSSGNEWEENTWTKRLVGALQRHLPNHNVKYTAELGLRFATTQSPLSGLGTDSRVLRCYIFRGSSDSTITTTNKVVPLGVGATPPAAATGGQSPQSEEESIAKQAAPQSKFPPKLGQLASTIHISLVQKAARMFLKHKRIENVLSVSGLYIDKSSLPLIVCLSMPVVCATDSCPQPIPRANLEVTNPRCTVLSKARLCKALQVLLGTVGSTRCTE